MEDSYKVLKCGKLYIQDIVFDSYDKLSSIKFTEHLANARRIHVTDKMFDNIDSRYEFIVLKTVNVQEV